MNPASLTAVSAGEVGGFRGGSTFPPRFQGRKSGDLPFFKVSDMNLPGNEIFMARANNYIDEDIRKRLGAVRLPAGAIVFAKVGAAVYLERKRILAQDSCIDNNMGAFVVDRSRHDVRFLHYVLDNIRLSSLVATTALPSLNGTQLRSIQLLMPASLDEQREIAASLSSADSLIDSVQRLIAKKESIKQGVMDYLLTGQIRLPGFNGSWTKVLLADLLDFKNGLNKSSEFFGSGTPIINFMDVMRSPVITKARVHGLVTLTGDEIKRFSARRGDIFFTRTSETVQEVGTAAVLSDEILAASFSGFLLRGRPKSELIDTTFLALLFQLESIRSQVVATASYTTRALTNGRSLGRVEVGLPSKAEQGAIVEVIADIDHDLDALRRRLVSIRALKQGMMQELLTGRTRLQSGEVAA